MRLMRLGPPGQESPAVEQEGEIYDLSPLTREIDGTFLAGHGIERVREALAAGSLQQRSTNGLRIASPVSRPSALVCIGMNYAAHAMESGAAPPEHPVVFLKTPNTVVGPDDIAKIPRGSVKTDWEVELGMVIGERASYLESPVEAQRHIAGYVTANDLSEREHQLEISGGQWSKGKCAPGFSPLGPWLVPADEVEAGNLRLRSWVNGEIRQDSTTSDMIFDVPFIVYHLSQFMVLEPGDVILTGTPEGVALSGKFPYVQDGDVVEIEVEGLGKQRQVFKQA